MVAFGMPPLSEATPAFDCVGGGNPAPGDETDVVVAAEILLLTVVIDPLPVDRTPFAPMLLTGTANVPVTVAIAAVIAALNEVVVDVVVVLLLLLLFATLVVVVETATDALTDVEDG